MASQGYVALMPAKLKTSPLSAAAFAPYGDVIEISGAPDKLINQGLCGRHHDLAKLDFADGRAGLRSSGIRTAVRPSFRSTLCRCL